MRIVILGANGQVGREVFRQCCHHYPAAEVIGCVRQFHLHFEGCTGNKHQHSFVFDPFSDEWSRLGKADVLVNCVGIIRESGDFTFERAHIGLTRLILKHREMLGDPRVVQVSVLGADKKSSSRFMSTKAIADEDLIKEENTCVVRPSIVCTPGTMMVQKLRMAGRIAKRSFNNLLFPEQFLSTRIQPVTGKDVGDVVAMLLLKRSAQRIINITGPEEIELKELVKMTGNNTRIIPVPKLVFSLLLPFAKLIAPGIVSREQLALLSDNNTADNAACSGLLGRPMQGTKDFWKKELQQ